MSSLNDLHRSIAALFHKLTVSGCPFDAQAALFNVKS